MANTYQDKERMKARMLYTTELMRKGWSNSQIIPHLSEKYNICNTSARNTIKKAYEWLKDNDASGYIEDIRKKQVERSEFLLQQAIEARNWDAANRIVDTLNKTLGIYENKQKVEIVADEIKFKFGGVDMKKGAEDGN